MASGNGVMIGNMMQQPVQQTVNIGQSPLYMPSQSVGVVTSKFRNTFGGSGIGSGPQHSYSTDDASLGEYKYTVNVGQRSIKITGDNFELIRTAKLVLDDYFSSAEFLQSIGDLDDYNHPYHHGGIMAQDAFVGNSQSVSQSQSAVVRDDSGIALDKKSPGKKLADEVDKMEFYDGDEESTKKRSIKKPVRKADNKVEFCSDDEEKNELFDDDEVFIVDENGKEIPIGSPKSSNVAKSESGASLARSKKSNNLRYSNSPITPMTVLGRETRIYYDVKELLEYSNSPFAWSLPHNWIRICEKLPALVRNKVNKDESNNNLRATRPHFNRHKSFDCATPYNTNNNRQKKSFTNEEAECNSASNPLNFTRSTSLCD